MPPAPQGVRHDRAAALQGLEAQTSLLPYALGCFAVGAVVLAWVARQAPNAAWFATTLVVFAVNWAAFYAVSDWRRRRPEQSEDAALRMRVHVLGGLLWAGAIWQVTALAMNAGPYREVLLGLALAGAVVCFAFTAPSRPNLLIVGGLAVLGPLLALGLKPETRPLASMGLSAAAMAMALALMVNRLLRRQFALGVEREALIAERADALARAEALARSKSDLVTALSQEVRSGLTGVAHVLGAAASGGRARATPSREQLDGAWRASRELLEVLDATLDAERAQAGALAVERRPFDLCSLVEDVASDWRPVAASKGLDLAVVTDAPAGAAVGDPLRTRQVLSALLSNAVQYTVRGRIEVRTVVHDRRARVEVSDTGPGLTCEETDRAFEPFSRVERTAAGVHGTGVGLSLARSLARLMGGDITAESAVGFGSRFAVDLEFDQTAGAPARPFPRETDAAPRALRVLVAFSEPLDALAARSTLIQLGHEVVQGPDAARALALAPKGDADAVLVDGALLGREDVRQAVSACRGRARPLPVIAVIGGDAEEAAVARDSGVAEVLRKPMSVSLVARALTAALGERSARAAA